MIQLFRYAALLIFSIMLIAPDLEAGQCQATTKKGTQCKRQAAAGSSYCWQHGGSSTPSRSTEMTKDTTARKISPSNEVTSTRCQATTKKGTQCKRNAKAGSKFCWQHGG